MKPLVISIVSYLNAMPYVYGLRQADFDFPFELRFDTPAESARSLQTGQADIGLVPVGALPQLPAAQLITNFGIGCIADVKTVALFAKKPLEELTHIYLDYQSRSSVKLIQVLAREHWKRNIEFIPAEKGFETKINNTTGGLIIGDRAMTALNEFPYFYDLGKEWFEFSSLPFVFATWVSMKSIPKGIEWQLQKALEFGVHKKLDVAKQEQHKMPNFSLEEYYRSNILYKLSSEAYTGMQLFQQLSNDPVSQLPLLLEKYS